MTQTISQPVATTVVTMVPTRHRLILVRVVSVDPIASIGTSAQAMSLPDDRSKLVLATEAVRANLAKTIPARAIVTRV